MAIAVADLLTVREAAEVLKVSVMTVYRAIYDGNLPAQRLGRGGNYRISRTDLERALTAWRREGR